MNLSKLFKIQKQLDDRIVKEKKLEGQNLLNKKILALQVELGELANEWRGFKFWSNDQEPKRNKREKCPVCNGNGIVSMGEGVRGIKVCLYCDNGGIKTTDPLLEEYVDTVHFTLSAGLEIEIKHEIFPEPINYGDVVIQFNELFGQISYFASVLKRENEWEEIESEYERIWSLLFGLAGLLGFTWEEIEQGYIAKNKINHARQESGY